MSEEKTEEKKEEKKENAFSQFWNKVKSSVNDAVLESKLENKFREGNTSFRIYQKDDLFGGNDVYGYYEGDNIVIWGQQSVKNFSVIIDESTHAAYYVVGSEETTASVEFEGTTYERTATNIAIDRNVEEVNVVKAGKRYFIYKGKTE